MEKAQREKAKDSNLITREYFDDLLVEMRHIGATAPDTGMTLYGRRFSTPVMMAALSHLKGQGGEGDGMVQMAQGALLAGAVNWAGMGANEQFAAIAATGAPTVRIIKPYADEELVRQRIRQAEELGALAVGMDLDHAFNAAGRCDTVLGYPMRPRTLAEIEGYCRGTSLPFIVKGVLSAADAKKCLEAGVGGIVVSHHHGVLPSIVPPLMVLPEIVEAVRGRMPGLCGLRLHERRRRLQGPGPGRHGGQHRPPGDARHRPGGRRGGGGGHQRGHRRAGRHDGAHLQPGPGRHRPLPALEEGRRPPAPAVLCLKGAAVKGSWRKSAWGRRSAQERGPLRGAGRSGANALAFRARPGRMRETFLFELPQGTCIQGSSRTDAGGREDKIKAAAADRPAAAFLRAPGKKR